MDAKNPAGPKVPCTFGTIGIYKILIGRSCRILLNPTYQTLNPHRRLLAKGHGFLDLHDLSAGAAKFAVPWHAVWTLGFRGLRGLRVKGVKGVKGLAYVGVPRCERYVEQLDVGVASTQGTPVQTVILFM